MFLSKCFFSRILFVLSPSVSVCPSVYSGRIALLWLPALQIPHCLIYLYFTVSFPVSVRLLLSLLAGVFICLCLLSVSVYLLCAHVPTPESPPAFVFFAFIKRSVGFLIQRSLLGPRTGPHQSARTLWGPMYSAVKETPRTLWGPLNPTYTLGPPEPFQAPWSLWDPIYTLKSFVPSRARIYVYIYIYIYTYISGTFTLGAPVKGC